VLILENEYILFATIIGHLLIVFSELFEYLRNVFHLFIDIDDLIGEDGVLVLEAFNFV
jgi:hypothetical protein